MFPVVRTKAGDVADGVNGGTRNGENVCASYPEVSKLDYTFTSLFGGSPLVKFVVAECMSTNVQQSLEMDFHGSVLRAPAILARGSFLVLAVVLVDTTDNADRGSL